MPLPHYKTPLIDRVLARVLTDPITGCWNWIGYKDHQGYGRISIAKAKQTSTHRFVYQHFRGALPSGLQIDHLCRNRGCANPDHMEPVTNYENSMRGNAPRVVLARANVCMHGHALVGGNVIYRKREGNGYRTCRACARRRSKGYAKKRNQT